MKNMAKVLDDVMKPRAYGHIFSQLYSMTSGTRLLLPKEERVSTVVKSGNAVCQGEKSENVKMRSAFEIENSTLHYFRATGNYRRTIAANRVAHTFVVYMSIHFGGTERYRGGLTGHANYGGNGEEATNNP